MSGPLATPADVLVSNATLQWVPDHLALLRRLLDTVSHGGWFAFQVPGNFDQPSHTIRRDLAAEAPYADHTAGVAVPSSHDPVFTWVSGTGARPTLQALPPDMRPGFEAELKQRLAAAYPPDDQGRVVLPFRRIFVVARRAS